MKVKVDKGKRGFFVFRWTDSSGRAKEKQTDIPAKPSSRNKAIREAARFELGLNNPNEIQGPTRWLDFQKRYESEYLDSKSIAYLKKWQTTVTKVDNHISPTFVNDITGNKLSQLYKGLTSEKLAESSIEGHFRHLLASLNWAQELQLIESVPKIRIAKQSNAKNRNKMKGRPINAEEFERMLAAVKKIRPNDKKLWKDFLNALWFSGLRLGEALRISWDWEAGFAVDLDCKFPRYVIRRESQKSGKDELLPIAPEFVDILVKTPKPKRSGRIFPISHSTSFVGKVISDIGNKAAVKVSHTGKTVSAQDLRRSFGSRWATKLMPAELRVLMRHASIQTTMEYYVELDADNLGKRLWELGGQTGGQTKNNQVKDELSKN